MLGNYDQQTRHITDNYTIDKDDDAVIATSIAGGKTATLPDAKTCRGEKARKLIANLATSGGTLTIASAVANQIVGTTSLAAGESIIVESDEMSYWVAGSSFSAEGLTAGTISTADSKGVSAGTRASVADSKALSVSDLTSTADSKGASSGTRASVADSKALSVSTLTSTADSKGASAGTGASTADSKGTSAGTGASTADSKGTSAGSGASVADSKAVSSSTVDSTSLSGTDSKVASLSTNLSVTTSTANSG